MHLDTTVQVKAIYQVILNNVKNYQMFAATLLFFKLMMNYSLTDVLKNSF